MIALFLGSVAWGAQAPSAHDNAELRQLEHFALQLVDVRDHRLVVLDGIVVIGRDRLEICQGMVDVRANHIQMFGRHGLVLERSQVWFGGRRLI